MVIVACNFDCKVNKGGVVLMQKEYEKWLIFDLDHDRRILSYFLHAVSLVVSPSGRSLKTQNSRSSFMSKVSKGKEKYLMNTTIPS